MSIYQVLHVQCFMKPSRPPCGEVLILSQMIQNRVPEAQGAKVIEDPEQVCPVRVHAVPYSEERSIATRTGGGVSGWSLGIEGIYACLSLT